MTTHSLQLTRIRTLRIIIALAIVFVAATLQQANGQDMSESTDQVTYHTEEIAGLDLFYREAGPKDAPTIVLLHGFPTSSHMFRNLIPQLSDKFHVIAPDYPGFGNSEMPNRNEFEYTFDNVADVIDELLESKKIDRYALYLMDYGAPVGFRIATKHPERVTGLVVQNGNAYEEGIDNDFWAPIKKYWNDESAENREPLRGFLNLDATKWQFLHGVRDEATISPDNWGHVQPLLDRPGNQEIQLDMFLSYGSNPPLYPEWQKYLRDNQPPTLIVWGKNDEIFPAAGAYPYKRDLQDLEFQPSGYRSLCVGRRRPDNRKAHA